MDSKELTEKETIALLQTKNEILALKKQFSQIDGSNPAQEYFFKFQKEIDLFEKKIGSNIKNLDHQSKKNINFRTSSDIFNSQDKHIVAPKEE